MQRPAVVWGDGASSLSALLCEGHSSGLACLGGRWLRNRTTRGITQAEPRTARLRAGGTIAHGFHFMAPSPMASAPDLVRGRRRAT